MANVCLGQIEAPHGLYLTRREFVRDALIVLFGLTVFPIHGNDSTSAYASNRIGNTEPFLPFKNEYSFEEIESSLSSTKSIRGANAIMVDKRSSEFGVPVLIPAQIPGRGVTTVELLSHDQILTSETTPDCLILPNRPLKNWWPTSNPNMPSSNVITETVKETQKGVSWLNEFLKSHGVNKTHIRTEDEVKINLVSDGGAYNQISCDINSCVQDIPIPPYMSTVRGADGGSLELNGQSYYYLDYIDHIHYASLVFKTLHERVHTSTAGFGFVEKYYENELGNIWTWALEKFTDGLAGLAVEHVFLPNEIDTRKFAALQNWTGNIGMIFIEKISSDLDNSLETVLHHGSTGDMVGLQKLYDSKYGENAFYNLRNTLMPR